MDTGSFDSWTKRSPGGWKPRRDTVPVEIVNPTGDLSNTDLFHFRSRETKENLNLCLACASRLHLDPVVVSALNFHCTYRYLQEISVGRQKHNIDAHLNLTNLTKWNDTINLLPWAYPTVHHTYPRCHTVGHPPPTMSQPGPQHAATTVENFLSSQMQQLEYSAHFFSSPRY